MKILQVFDFFSPHGGGTVDLLGKISGALAGKGHEVEIYTSDYKLDEGYIAALPEVTIRPFHCVMALANYYYAPGFKRAVQKHLSDFDVAHLHCFRSYQNIVISREAPRAGVPYVLDTHGSLPRQTPGTTDGKAPLRSLFDMFWGKRILNNAGRLVAETQLGMSEYRQVGVPEERIALVPPPFETQAFADLPQPGAFRRRFGLENKKIVMFLGRIHRIKGLDVLAAGFTELAKREPAARLVIVGNDDGYKAALEKLIKRLGIAEKVIFAGFLNGPEKLEALVDADVVAQTSRYEQGAWAPFEAVLCGTPIVVSDNSGAGEDVAKHEAGYLAAFGDEKDLAEKLAWVLANPQEAGRKTARARQHIITDLSLEKGIERYEQLYQAVTRRQD
ncbi:glycosyltransferase family 4 protein [Chloroflexota bacterium]